MTYTVPFKASGVLTVWLGVGQVVGWRAFLQGNEYVSTPGKEHLLSRFDLNWEP